MPEETSRSVPPPASTGSETHHSSLITHRSDYVELHCHTNYSMLDGASHPEDLVARAKELRMEALAVTDHDGLYGAVRFWQAALQEGIRPIVGAEITLEDGCHLTLLARDRRGYSNLCRLISAAQLAHGKHQAALALPTLAEHSAGLICLTGCRKGEIAQQLLAGSRRRARRAAERYLRIFGAESLWVELQHHLQPEDDWLCDEMADLAAHLGLGCVATNDVHYARREGHRLQDILVCIKNRTKLDDAAGILRPNSEYHLKSGREMAAIFRRYPGAIANSRVIAEQCHVDLNFKGYRFPGFQVPEGETPFSYLYRLCHEGVRERYSPITPAVLKQLAHELEVIQKTGLAEYFLIVWDIMRYAREQGIPGQGRGSAADSLVAYVLGITKVDPLRHNLLFERFLSEEMTGMPDIDIDFSTNHRERIIRYVYEKYGQEHTAMVCNVVTYRARSALREVGKAMGLPLDLLDRFAKAVNHRSPSHLEGELEALTAHGTPDDAGRGLAPRRPEGPAAPTGERGPGETPTPAGEASSPPLLPQGLTEDEAWRQLLDLCRQIEGFPRHLSIHVGGMLITAAPLVEIAPLERATAPGRVVVQFNKDDVEDMGLIKMDLLGLRTLSVIHDALEMIRETRGAAPNLDRIPLDDPAVYDMLCEPDNIGVFQVESRAQSQTLPKMQPRSIEDLIVEISIIRPGPIQGNMVHPYLRRRAGIEKVTYLHPSLEPILRETLGVVLFQEQVIRVAVAVAGFTPGEADLFRRAMNRHRSATEMARIETRFLEGAIRNGVERETARTIFRQLAGFASYGFCKSHAAAFAKTAYDTAYLKRYYPSEFYAAILNNQPMGFYSPEVVANDAKRHGIRILPVDVNLSRGKCTVENGDIRLGFSYVRGLGEAAIQRLEEEQRRGPFHSLRDFFHRARLSREAMENLIAVGALDCFGRPRREMLWEVGAWKRSEDVTGRREKAETRRLGDGGTGRTRISGLSIQNPALGSQHSVPSAQNPVPDSVPSPQSSVLDLAPPPPPALPALTRYEETAAEYSLLGMSPGRHAVELFRSLLEDVGAVTCDRVGQLPKNLVVRVGGLVVCEQAPPTASGHVFLTLEDETGLANVILRPQVYQRFRRVLQTNQIVVIEGLLQRQDRVTSLMGRKVSSLPETALLATGGAKRPHRR
ncbi:MAG: DNA polymerase III subunit alpha [Sphingomonadaceae bacterium]